MPAALRAPLMAIGEDGDALLLRTWRASHDWKERPPLDAQGREPTWWQPGTAEQHGSAKLGVCATFTWWSGKTWGIS